MEHLIESVRGYPCLWNTTAIEYRDQELKDAAWAEVMKDTDLCSVKEVKLKWKKLRDSYRDALKRQNETQAREGGKRPYPWKYMGLMGFLQPHMGARKRAEAAAEPEPPPPPHPATNGARGPEHGAGVGAGAGDSSDSSDSESARSEPAAPVAPVPAKRRALHDIDRKLSYLCHREPAAAAAAAPAPLADPLDIFFNSMCQATKRLGFGAQLKVKRALFEAVAAAEENLLAEQASLAALWARAPSSSSDDGASSPAPPAGAAPAPALATAPHAPAHAAAP